MLEALKTTKKVLECVVVDKPGRAISDEHVSYMCEEQAKVGDIFTVWFRGKLAIVQVEKVHPLWAYSISRTGLGDPNTMSYVIGKVDLTSHSAKKKARAFARDIEAAFKERMEQESENLARKEFIKKLAKDEAAKFEELMAVREAVLADPNKVDELLNMDD